MRAFLTHEQGQPEAFDRLLMELILVVKQAPPSEQSCRFLGQSDRRSLRNAFNFVTMLPRPRGVRTGFNHVAVGAEHAPALSTSTRWMHQHSQTDMACPHDLRRQAGIGDKVQERGNGQTLAQRSLIQSDGFECLIKVRQANR